jgi:hypothetical protein
MVFGLSLLLSACTVGWSRTFHHLEPISPSPGVRWFTEVDSLQPELSWKPAPDRTVAYDLVVWETDLDPDRAAPGITPSSGRVVYHRTGLLQPAHRLETPLGPKRVYFWSVRTRQRTTVGPWSSYEAWVALVDLGVGERISFSVTPFGFRTPPW